MTARLASALALLLFLAAPLAARADDLDDAMQRYLDSIRYANTVAFLHCFSHTQKWKFVSYRAGTSAIVGTTTLTYDQTEEAIQKHLGFYTAFFKGMAQYSYPARICAHPLSMWRRMEENVYRLPETEGISFVRWRQEDGQWIIASIGDDAP